MAVGQLATASITISTSQTPSAACTGFVFTVDETTQTLPTFMTWNAGMNILSVSPLMSTVISQYTVRINYGKGSYTFDYLDVVVDVQAV